MKATILTLFSLSMLLLSCEKYEEGGRPKKADDQIIGYWRMAGYSLNGDNATPSVIIRNYTETYEIGGGYVRTYTVSDSLEFNETGSWQLTEDKLTLNVTGMDSLYYFSESSPALYGNNFRVVKLTKDELWYEFDADGGTHQFQLFSD